MGFFTRLIELKDKIVAVAPIANPVALVAAEPAADRAPELYPPRSMAHVVISSPGKLPVADISQFVGAVNRLIDEYNTIVIDNPRKEQILQTIQEKIKEMDYKFKPSHIAGSADYRQAQATLFKEIQYQMASLGKETMSQTPGPQSHLAEVISNMAPDKADALLAILDTGNPTLEDELKNLYTHDDVSAEAIRFRVFLMNHEISYLGGGNSRNYKIQNTEINDGRASVLKVDNRLDMAKSAEGHLRNAFSEQFTPIESERLVTYNDPNGAPMTRTLVVTELCTGGSLIDEMKRITTPDEQLEKTCNRFEQMANALLRIQQAGCMFPDAKASNWLVDEQGRVRISDTKSFLFTDKDGNYSKTLPENKHLGVSILTPGFIPPECREGEFNANSVHAFILGNNLHAYLTHKGTKGSDYDYSADVFATNQGREFKALIEALVKPNPAERMSVQDAMNELFMIKNPECRTLFNELNQLKIGPKDEKMQAYISAKQQEYREADPAGKAALLGQLHVLVDNLQADKAVQEVVTIVKDLREKTGLFNMGMATKADRIESAMANVPIEQRQNFILSGGSTEVLKALASHQSLFYSGTVYLNEYGHIDTQKAETTFKDFKEKFKEQMAALDAKNNGIPDMDPEPNPTPQLQ